MSKIKEFWKNNREKNWFIIALLILFFPVGIYLMWKYSGWKKAPKWAVTALFVILVFAQTPAEEREAEEDDAQSDEVATERESANLKKEISEEKKAEIARQQADEKKKAEDEKKATEEKAEQERIEKEEAEKKKAEDEKKATEEKAEQERIEKEEAEKKKAEDEETEKLAAAAEKEAEEKLKKQKETDQATAEELYLTIMRDSVGMYVDVEFDKENKIFTLTPIDQQLIDEISLLPTGVGHAEWGTLVDGMTTMSEGGKELVGEGYTMNLVNPQNEENIILWIVDGVVIYDVIDEL